MAKILKVFRLIILMLFVSAMGLAHGAIYQLIMMI